jgi:hypothetical protein
VSELIAVPVESDRRAVQALAALRRLQAEYEGDPGRPGASALEEVNPIVSRPDRQRRPRLRLRTTALAALVGGAVGAAGGLAGAAMALHCGAPAPGAPLTGGVPGDLPGAGVGWALGAAAGAILAVLLLWFPRGRPVRTRVGPKVTWLVSYVVRDARPPGSRLVRASVLQITLPADAEGRLRAILSRADAAAAR